MNHETERALIANLQVHMDAARLDLISHQLNRETFIA